MIFKKHLLLLFSALIPTCSFAQGIDEAINSVFEPRYPGY